MKKESTPKTDVCSLLPKAPFRRSNGRSYLGRPTRTEDSRRVGPGEGVPREPQPARHLHAARDHFAGSKIRLSCWRTHSFHPIAEAAKFPNHPISAPAS